MLKHRLNVVAVPALLAFGLAACGEDEKKPGPNPNPTPTNTIVDVAIAAGSFSTLVGALESTGLDETLRGAGPFTVFAPTDAAFALLPAGLVASLDQQTLSSVLTYHVVSGRVPASQVVGLNSATTVQGDAVDIAVIGGTVVLDGRVQVTQTDISASNGIIHVIDAVLIPGQFPGSVVDALAASPRFSTLAGAVGAAGLAGALGDSMGSFTVFAPSNGAFELLPDGLVAGLDTATLTAVLQYHVLGAEVGSAAAIAKAGSVDPSAATLLSGNSITLGLGGSALYIDERAQVIYTDIETANGTIHILDSVLIPGPFPGNNVEALSSYPRFASLVGAVAGAGLAPALADGSGAGFTIFAPTNAAFAAVDLSGFSSAEIQSILEYHVLSGQVGSSTVVTLPSARTLEGSAIAIDVDGGVTLNGTAEVIWVDFQTSNGIIHIIDQVITPRETIVDVAVAAGSFTTLAGALVSTGLDAALDGSGPFTVFAPTDAAFALLPAGLVASLDNATLSSILLYHVAGAELRAAQVVAASSAETLNGADVSIQVRGSTVVLDGRVQVTSTDILADNGVIHVIDAVLIPGDFPGTVVDALAASPRFSTLVGAVVGANLAGALSSSSGTFTVFAPTNAGFGLLPTGLVASLDPATLTAVLQYHVLGSEVDSTDAIAAAGSSVATLLTGSNLPVQVDGGGVVLDGRAQVEYVDIATSNGIIHVLDSVLVPGEFPGTIVDALASYPRFSTLVGAVVSQNLAGTLSDTSGAGFTVFAPTNNAFAPVNLGAFSSAQLTSILTFHVLPEPKDSGAVTGAATHATVLGQDLTLSGLRLNDQADITFVDIEASNGFIHVINGVLVPTL